MQQYNIFDDINLDILIILFYTPFKILLAAGNTDESTKKVNCVNIKLRKLYKQILAVAQQVQHVWPWFCWIIRPVNLVPEMQCRTTS